MHYEQPIWTGESPHVRVTSIYLYFVPDDTQNLSCEYIKLDLLLVMASKN